jgi:phenylpyruvate tautomerase PptA (4-oxalocrotonate tautomerase family)
MVALGMGYQPDEIKLMRSALDEAAITLPEAERTSAMKAKLASRILAAAAKGERDPNKLRIAALLEEMDV